MITTILQRKPNWISHNISNLSLGDKMEYHLMSWIWSIKKQEQEQFYLYL